MQKLFENRFVKIAGFLLLGGLGYYFLLRSYDISIKASFSEAVGSYFWMMIFSFFFYRLYAFYQSRHVIGMVYLSLIIVFSLLTTLLMQWYGRELALHDQTYRSLLQHLFFVRGAVIFLVFLVIAFQLWIDRHARDQEQVFNRLIDQERQLVKAEINNLQQQFRPHFLFNSLNSISALVKTRPGKAREMLINLSDLLRLSLQKEKEDFIDIKEEIRYLKLYTAMEKLRFGDRLSIKIEAAHLHQEARLPALVLQPLIENAIKYAGEDETGRLAIAVKFEQPADVLWIKVENTYDQDKVVLEKGTGFGLRSIDRKLTLLYKKNNLLRVERTKDTFKVLLKIPQEK